MQKLTYKDSLTLSRMPQGVLKVQATNEEDLYFGQGYAQALDRAMQMILTRVLGQGRATELLQDDADMLKIDIFFRKMNWKAHTAPEFEKLTERSRRNLAAWCAGVNHRLKEKTPWEFRLLRVPIEPWTIEDCLLFLRIVSYIGLQQTQAEMERFFIQLIQAQIPIPHLQELFPKETIQMDVARMKEVKLGDEVIPKMTPWVAGFQASNNWAITGEKSASGKPLLANDPHLEGNRLPNIWQEFCLQCGDRYGIGATMPGIPGILVGRNNDVAWGATYACMDALDSWIEECEGGQYFKDGAWRPFEKRSETILRKKNAPYTLTLYENEHGLLDRTPEEKGAYLATLWSGAKAGGISLNHLFHLLDVKNTEEMMDTLGAVEFPFSWAMADRHGNIGYQMSGLLPKRPEGVSGLTPLDGRTSAQDWQGFWHCHDLPRQYNPSCGYVFSCNNDLNHLSKIEAINLPIDYYRCKRIDELLAAHKIHSLETVKQIQYDTYSYQAKAYMEKLLPLLDDSPAGKILKAWDCRYDPEQKAPWVFEKFYRALLIEVFSHISADRNAIHYLFDNSFVFILFTGIFDQVLLKEDSLWFEGRKQKEIFADVWKREMSVLSEKEIPLWSKEHCFSLTNIFFQSKLPKFLGFDQGPLALPGGRATVFQSQVFKNGSRLCTYLPSLRLFVDLNTSGLCSHILGGPSDRRFSKWYTSEVENWKKRIYKEILPS